LMRCHLRRILLAVFTFVSGLAQPALAQTSPQPAVPLEPISAILDAFKTHDLVGLGEVHSLWQIEEFRERLIRDQRFQQTVHIIVVESGNANFQNVIDDFVRGDEVPYETLHQVWKDAPKVFEQPMYEQFFRAVRAVNASLGKELQLRVLLGEDPTHRDRDRFVADLIRREVLAKHQRALITYGEGHFFRHDPIADGRIGAFYTMTMDLERNGEAKVFGIWANSCENLPGVQSSISRWPVPSLALLRGTVLGRAYYARYSSFGGWRLNPDGQPAMVNGRPVIDPPRVGLRMEDQYDALLYLGPASAMRFSENPMRCPK
jgi:hypothetical protein